MGMLIFSPTLKNLNSVIIPQRLDKNSGFVQEDNSGRSNIFSTGDKALYSYSPTSDKAMRQGLGGAQGLVIVTTIAALVVATTFGIGLNNNSDTATDIDLTNLETLTEIASRFL